jgi:uncharacterized protein (TIGR02246 family)
MKRNLIVAIGVMTMAVACAPGGEKHDMAADVAAIAKVRDGYAAAFKSGNATSLGALFTADAHSMGNAQPTATGSQGVEAATKAMMDQMSGQDIVITPEKTDVSGDMAYDRGSYKTTLTPKGGAPMVEEGRYLVVLKRQADGSWKLAEEMGNLPTAPAPAPAPPKARAKK